MSPYVGNLQVKDTTIFRFYQTKTARKMQLIGNQ